MPGTGQQAADEVLTDTAGLHCQQCCTDLWLSAVVSTSAPGQAVCPEHAAALGAAASTCCLLFRHSIEELQRLVFETVVLFPGCDEYIKSSQQRVRQRPWMRVKSLGPIRDLEEEYPVPRAPDIKQGGRDPATPVAGGCSTVSVHKAQGPGHVLAWMPQHAAPMCLTEHQLVLH